MPRYTATITTPRTPEEAFEYLADFSSVAEWDPSVEEARRLDPSHAGKGARFEVVMRFLGRRTTLVYETVELDRPHRVVLRASTDAIVSTDTITFARTGDGTELTYDADLALKGALRLAEVPMRIAFRRLGERARAGLMRSLQ